MALPPEVIESSVGHLWTWMHLTFKIMDNSVIHWRCVMATGSTTSLCPVWNIYWIFNNIIGWIAISLRNPFIGKYFFLHHHKVDTCDFEWKVSTAIASKCGADNHVPVMMNHHNFGGDLISLLFSRHPSFSDRLITSGSECQSLGPLSGLLCWVSCPTVSIVSVMKR